MKSRAFVKLLGTALAICICAGAAGCGASDKGNNQNAAADEAADAAGLSQEAAADDAEAGAKDATVSDSKDSASDGENMTLTPSEDMADIGITLNLPDAYVNADGIIDMMGADYSDGQGVYLGEALYLGMSIDEYYEIVAKEELTDEDLVKIQNQIMPLFTIAAIDDDREADALIRMLDEIFGEGTYTEQDLTLLNKAGDCSFFELADSSFEDNYSNLSEVFAKEYDTLISMKDVVLENAEFSPVTRPFAELIGSKVSFTTTDLDGNPVSSEEIFGAHEITMVNVWATWCHWCVDELPELEKISSRLAEKDCAVIGLCGDAESDDIIAKAKNQLAENNDTYLNICPWDGWQDTFDMSNGWPTTFFVDRNGVIVGKPVIGAAIDVYEPTVEALLEDKAGTAQEETADEDSEVNEAYNIYVVDQDAQPVEGAMVQFCTEDTCKMAKTDASGLASFADPEGIYDVHVLKVPEGYEDQEEVYKTDKKYGDMFITVEKK